MTNELMLQWITGVYAVCNVVRIVFYVPQLVAVMRDPAGACAISLSTWTFWSFSHAVTTVYCGAVVNDLLLAAMMLGNTLGSCAIVTLTARRRFVIGKLGDSL